MWAESFWRHDAEPLAPEKQQWWTDWLDRFKKWYNQEALHRWISLYEEWEDTPDLERWYNDNKKYNTPEEYWAFRFELEQKWPELSHKYTKWPIKWWWLNK